MFDIGGLAGLSQAAYDAFEPVQWPLPADAAGTAAGTQRLFEDGRYAFTDGRARFVPTAARAPATRSPATHTGPNAAISRGSSPVRAASWRRSSTRSGPVADPP